MELETRIKEVPECAVCLQSCNHPTQLPCGHIFCFLCAKGVAIQNKRCAMCRQDIPSDYLDHPVLLGGGAAGAQHSDALETDPDPAAHAETFQWYYEGRNGWWMYDERSNSELEAAHGAGAGECQLLLAGALYHVNFHTMLQYRRNDITRRRRVKRDLPAAPAKGIAGIKMMSTSDTERAKNVDSPEPGEAARASGSAACEAPPADDEQQDAPIIPPPPQFDIVQSLRGLSLSDANDNDPQSLSSEQE